MRGLGKTTFFAAMGYYLAREGHKVLVFSVDPQASLSNIFNQDLFGKGPVKVMDEDAILNFGVSFHAKELAGPGRRLASPAPL